MAMGSEANGFPCPASMSTRNPASSSTRMVPSPKAAISVFPCFQFGKFSFREVTPAGVKSAMMS